MASRLDLGTHVFTRDSIIHFASHYDPQRFHLSDEGARETHFGKLCASGWHTGAVWMRKMIDTQQRLDAEAAARGRDCGPRRRIAGVQEFALAGSCFCR